MKCRNCGTRIPNESIYCPICDTKIEESGDTDLTSEEGIIGDYEYLNPDPMTISSDIKTISKVYVGASVLLNMITCSWLWAIIIVITYLIYDRHAVYNNVTKANRALIILKVLCALSWIAFILIILLIVFVAAILS